MKYFLPLLNYFIHDVDTCYVYNHYLRCGCSETCLKQPLKIDKTKVLKPCGSLMQVKHIAGC